MSTASKYVLDEARTSRFAKINEGEGLKDFTLHYHDAGEGPVVVMLHGGGPGASGWSNFSQNLQPFVDGGFRVLLVDQPGYAKSDEIVGNIAARGRINAQAAKGLLDVLGIEKAHLLGNSMGGGTALIFALEFPDRVDRLVLMAPGGLGPSLFQPEPMEGIKYMFEVMKDPTADNFNQMLDALVADPRTISPELRQHRLNAVNAYSRHVENLRKSLSITQFGRSFDLAARLHEIKAKTLAIWGRNDRFVPLDHAFMMLAVMPDCDLHVFQRCGHSAQLEVADKFNPLVIDFLRT